MKIPLFLFCCMQLLLFSCNQELFIDELSPSVNGSSVQSDGSTMCIDLGTGDWSINSVYTDEGTLYGDIYDLEGHLLSGDKPLCSEGLVRMVSRHPMVDFVLERNRTDELLLTVKENPGGVAFPLFIVVGNQYEARTINLSLEPSEPYRLDSISYVLYSYGVRDSLSFANGDETVVVCNSHSSQSLQSLIYPFRNASAWVKFTALGREPLDLLGTDRPLVHIPVSSDFWLILSDGTYALSSEYIPVAISEQLKSVSEKVTVPPLQSMTIKTKCWYEEKSIDCTLYVTHPRTGRKRQINAVCERLDPVDYTLYYEAIPE